MDVLLQPGQVLSLLPYRFSLSLKRMQPQPSSTLYIVLGSLCLRPPRIHKKRRTKTRTFSLSSGWLPVCENT